MSINAVITDSAGAGTNVLFGMLAEHSLMWAFLAGAVLCVAGGILVRCCAGKITAQGNA